MSRIFILLLLEKKEENFFDTHFLASNHLEPNNFGNNGIIRSSARNRSFSLRSILLASNALNLPFNFSTPTTLEMNFMLCVSRRSLYCRCGSLVSRHTELVRGSTRGWTMGLSNKIISFSNFFFKKSKNMLENIHFEWFEFMMGWDLFNCNVQPDMLVFSWK